MMKKAWQEKNFSVLAAVTATAATAAMLFKMDKALSIYIRQNDPRRQKKQDEDEEIVGI